MFTDFVKFRDAQVDKHLKPIIVFPEGTHSNGRGILQFDDNLLKLIIRAAEWQQVTTHAIRIDYNKFKYFSPYNTTDVRGYWHSFLLLIQFINLVTVTIYYNLDKELPEKRSIDAKQEFIVHSMTNKGKEYALKVNHRDHA